MVRPTGADRRWWQLDSEVGWVGGAELGFTGRLRQPGLPSRPATPGAVPAHKAACSAAALRPALLSLSRCRHRSRLGAAGRQESQPRLGKGCCRAEFQPHLPQFSLSDDGFRFQRFRRARGTCPGSLRGQQLSGGERPCLPHSEAGVAGTGRGLGGHTRPPGAWVLGSRGCSFGVTSCFQKVEHNIRKPTRRNSPPTRGTIPTPLPFFIPSSPASSSCPFLLPPLSL